MLASGGPALTIAGAPGWNRRAAASWLQRVFRCRARPCSDLNSLDSRAVTNACIGRTGPYDRRRSGMEPPCGRQLASAGLPLPGAALLEAVEDQVQPELELVAVVIARLQNVLGRQLGEVGESLGGELLEEGHGHLRGLLRAAEGQPELLHREAVEVAVDGRDRMGRQLDGEASPPQAADNRIVVPERCRASVQPRVHQPDGPGVPAQRVAGGGGAVAHRSEEQTPEL